jgi:hypothetical protein
MHMLAAVLGFRHVRRAASDTVVLLLAVNAKSALYYCSFCWHAARNCSTIQVILVATLQVW